jgi:hypothetical protein
VATRAAGPAAPVDLNTIRAVDLRRVLLLFAIVLGVAAIASTLAGPRDDGGGGGDTSATDTAPKAPPPTEPTAQAPRTTTIEFATTAKPRTRELEVGRPATVLVKVEAPGQVDIPSLGLTAPAEPLTPALFELLASAPGSHAIVLQPSASQGLPSKVGTLKVVPAADRHDAGPPR